MNDCTKAVFLSYASQDAEAARRLCEALRGAGVEVWLDQDGGLVGGDSWDAKIRGQIASCALFVPIISANTQARLEGYFRLEWKLAAQRTHTMADEKAFLLPVVIDTTRDAEAKVPAEFRAVQWTRLPDGGTPAPFCSRVKTLLRGELGARTSSPLSENLGGTPSRPGKSSASGQAYAFAGVFVLLIAVAIWRPWRDSTPPSSHPEPKTQNPKSIALAPAKSVAVLPFANLSPDQENAFFADGMHEELLTALAKIRDLKVISRTSVLAYRDAAKRNLKQIAAELGVANVLEGSVRRDGNKVRITVQLIEAATDTHRWADNYTGGLTDVFKLQAEISGRIAQTLAAKLSPEEKAALVPKLTENPAAYDMYLKGKSNFGMGYLTRGRARFEEAITKPLEEAVALDPSFAAAWAALSQAHLQMHGRFDPSPERFALAKEAVNRAVHLNPKLAEVQVALGIYYGQGTGEWPRAVEQYAHALAIAPGDSGVVSQLAIAQFHLGRWAEGMANFNRVTELDPGRADRPAHRFQMTQGLIAQRLYRKAEDLISRRQRDESGELSANTLAGLAAVIYLRDRDRARYVAAVAEIKSTDAREDRQWAYRREMLAGRFAEAAAIYATSDDSDPAILNYFQSRSFCRAAWLAGDRAAAKARAFGVLAQQWVVEARDGRRAWRNLIFRAQFHAFAGEPERARELAEQALTAMPLSRDALDGPTVLLSVAEIELLLGDKERALALLERALSVPSPVLYNEGHPHLDPLWSPLWQDVRYKAALAKMSSLD
jgi:TolB-like protein/Tfp pilus assembly protein PilF